jgi:hypothetical protein
MTIVFLLYSEEYTDELSRHEHLQDVGIRLMWDGLTIGVRDVYHRHIFSSISSADRLANEFTTLNEIVVKSQIQMMKDRLLLEITPGTTRFYMHGMLYHVTSRTDEDNIEAVALNPPAARGQPLPANTSESDTRALLLSVHGGTTIRRPVGASCTLVQMHKYLSSQQTHNQFKVMVSLHIR